MKKEKAEPIEFNLFHDYSYRVKFNDIMHRSYRTYYFTKNVAFIVADYYFSFRKLETGSPEEIEMEHIVNLRSANRIYNMCE